MPTYIFHLVPKLCLGTLFPAKLLLCAGINKLLRRVPQAGAWGKIAFPSRAWEREEMGLHPLDFTLVCGFWYDRMIIPQLSVKTGRFAYG